MSNEQQFEISQGRTGGAWKMLIYGTPGVGKSTFGTAAPSPFFLDLENGLKEVDCHKTKKRLTSLDDVLNWLRWFIKSEYKTIVIDTVDELEKFLAAKVIGEYNKDNRPVKTIADIPYGRGGDLLVAEWRRFIEIMDHIHDAGKNILFVGHEQIVKFENPTDANFDFYTVNVHKKAAPVLTAKLDAVLFARFETVVKGTANGKGKAASTGERILCTNQGASWVAKNRYNLPETMPIGKDVFSKIQ